MLENLNNGCLDLDLTLLKQVPTPELYKHITLLRLYNPTTIHLTTKAPAPQTNTINNNKIKHYSLVLAPSTIKLIVKQAKPPTPTLNQPHPSHHHPYHIPIQSPPNLPERFLPPRLHPTLYEYAPPAKMQGHHTFLTSGGDRTAETFLRTCG
jgi:hypothetical protein